MREGKEEWGIGGWGGGGEGARGNTSSVVVGGGGGVWGVAGPEVRVWRKPGEEWLDWTMTSACSGPP